HCSPEVCGNSSNIAHRQHGVATQSAGAFLEFLGEQIGFPKVQQISLPLRRRRQNGRAVGVIQNHRALRRVQRGKLNRPFLTKDEPQESFAILEETGMVDSVRAFFLPAWEWRGEAALGWDSAKTRTAANVQNFAVLAPRALPSSRR